MLPCTHKDINRQTWELPKSPQSWWLASALGVGRIQTQFSSPQNLASIIRWKAVLSQHAPNCLFNHAVGLSPPSHPSGVGRQRRTLHVSPTCPKAKDPYHSKHHLAKVLITFSKNRCISCSVESSHSPIKQDTRCIYPRTPSMQVIIALKPLHWGKLIMKSMNQRPNLLPGIGSGFNRPAGTQVLKAYVQS